MSARTRRLVRRLGYLKRVKAADVSLPLARSPPGAAPFLSAAAASPAHACGEHATSGSCRPHPARPRPGPLPPPARSASQGCWPRQAFACRGPRPTRFPGDQTECPTAGTWPGACLCRQPPGRCHLAWHPPNLLRASRLSQDRPGEPGPRGNSQITLSGVPPIPSARILAALLVVRTLTCRTSARFRARAPGPVSGQLYETASGETGHAVRFPAAFRAVEVGQRLIVAAQRLAGLGAAAGLSGPPTTLPV
jgi:hypothetical protein